MSKSPVKIGNLILPTFQDAVGVYRKCIRNGNLLLTSTHFGMNEEGKSVTGKVCNVIDEKSGIINNSESNLNPNSSTIIDADAAKLVARNAGLRLLSTLHHFLDGDLDKIEQVIRIVGVVNGTPDFTRHGYVIDGCCEVLCEALGEERGRGVRTCLGAGSLASVLTCDIEVRLKEGA